MYLCPSEIRQTRVDALHFLLSLSHISLDAGERLAGLALNGGRQALAVAGNAWDSGRPGSQGVTPWLDLGGIAAALLEEAYEVAGHSHRSFMQAMESQVTAMDRLFITAIDRGARTSPWEGEIALNAVRAALQSAEAGLHGITGTAIQAIEIAEEQARQAAASLAAATPGQGAGSRDIAVGQK